MERRLVALAICRFFLPPRIKIGLTFHSRREPPAAAFKPLQYIPFPQGTSSNHPLLQNSILKQIPHQFLPADMIRADA